MTLFMKYLKGREEPIKIKEASICGGLTDSFYMEISLILGPFHQFSWALAKNKGQYLVIAHHRRGYRASSDHTTALLQNFLGCPVA